MGEELQWHHMFTSITDQELAWCEHPSHARYHVWPKAKWWVVNPVVLETLHRQKPIAVCHECAQSLLEHVFPS